MSKVNNIRQAGELKILHKAAIAGLVLLVPAAGVFKMWTESFDFPVHQWVLLIATACVLIFWIAATYTELEILTAWLSPAKYAAPKGMAVATAFALFAAFLTLLVYTIMNIQLYALLYTIFAVICVLTNSLWGQTEIAFAEQESRAALPPRNRQATNAEDKKTEASYIVHDAIRDFYANRLGKIEKKKRYLLIKYRLTNQWNWWKNGYFLRHVAYVPACFTVWVMAVIAGVHSLIWLEAVCYWMMASIIVVGEAILFFWRLGRDNRIREADEIRGVKNNKNEQPVES